MIKEVELYLFILSIIFSSRFLIEFITILRQDNIEPLKVSKFNQVFLYLSISYILTYIINIIIK